MNTKCWVFNFSGIYDHESFYLEDKGSFNVLDMKEISGTNCMCDDAAVSEIKRILESLCSGDKTNMTELILKMQNILYTNYKKNESVIITHCDYIFNKIIQTINNLLNEKKYIPIMSNIFLVF